MRWSSEELNGNANASPFQRSKLLVKLEFTLVVLGAVRLRILNVGIIMCFSLPGKGSSKIVSIGRTSVAGRQRARGLVTTVVII